MIEFIVISSSITSLIILEKFGRISVNNNVIKIIAGIYLAKISYEGFIKLSETFLINP